MSYRKKSTPVRIELPSGTSLHKVLSQLPDEVSAVGIYVRLEKDEDGAWEGTLTDKQIGALAGACLREATRLSEEAREAESSLAGISDGLIGLLDF